MTHIRPDRRKYNNFATNFLCALKMVLKYRLFVVVVVVVVVVFAVFFFFFFVKSICKQLDYYIRIYTMAEFKSFVMNNNAFGYVFCSSQKSFHTFLRFSDPNNGDYRSFFRFNNSILIYKSYAQARRNFYDFVNQYVIVGIMIASLYIIRIGSSCRGKKALL